MDKQITIDGLPPKDTKITADKNAKRRWENGFQKWSNEQAQEFNNLMTKADKALKRAEQYI